MDKDNIKIDELRNNISCNADKKFNFNIMSLFNLKNIKVIVLIIVLLVILILYFVVGNKTNNEEVGVERGLQYKSTLEYCEELESKLESVLSQLKGAGDVKVMVSVDGSPELIYASDTDNKTSSTANGTTTTSSSSPIILSGSDGSNPLVLTEQLPKVKGVVIVATGASQIGIKLDILNAVSTLLDISTEKISVLQGI